MFDDIRRRLNILPVGVDVNAQSISPDGRSLLLTATAEGQQNLYIYSLDELAREPAVARQLTSTAGSKADAQFTPDGREVFYLEQGRITVIAVETRQPRTVAENGHLHGAAGRRFTNQTRELPRTACGLTVVVDDDVALLQTGAIGRSALPHALDQDT